MQWLTIEYVCWCSVAKFCLTLWELMDYSTPGFPVLHHLLELAQTHVLWVGDAIQPSHPLLPLSPPALQGVSSVQKTVSMLNRTTRASLPVPQTPGNSTVWKGRSFSTKYLFKVDWNCPTCPHPFPLHFTNSSVLRFCPFFYLSRHCQKIFTKVWHNIYLMIIKLYQLSDASWYQSIWRCLWKNVLGMRK